MASLQNSNPTIVDDSIYELSPRSLKKRTEKEFNPNLEDQIDSHEIFDLVKLINDPEHPLTLQQLKIVSPQDIHIKGNYIKLYFTPTIPHCSLAQTIGLFLKVKLIRSLPQRMKVEILIKPGTHSAEQQVNKQINDKERVAAALENFNVVNLVNKGIRDTDLLPKLDAFLKETNTNKISKKLIKVKKSDQAKIARRQSLDVQQNNNSHKKENSKPQQC